jgi:hypothetical protein
MYKLARWNGYGSQGVDKLDEQGNASMHIPADPANVDYQAFLKYQEEGGKVYGADEEIPDGQTSQ